MEHLSVVEWCVLAYVCIAPIVAVILMCSLFADLTTIGFKFRK